MFDGIVHFLFFTQLPSGHVEVHYQSGSQTAVEIVPDSDVAAKTIHKLSELQIWVSINLTFTLFQLTWAWFLQ